MQLKEPPKSRRMFSAVAVLLGVGLLAFELRRLHESGAEGWFWIGVAGLMIVLGLFGVFERSNRGS